MRNQTMLLDFDGKSLPIEHKTKIGSLTDLWAIGNSIRASKGLSEMNMGNYLQSPETLELVEAIERKYGIFKPVDYIPLKKEGRVETIKSDLIQTKRGKYGGGTWAHKFILLDAAHRFGVEFRLLVYEKISNFENILKALNEFEVDAEIISLSPKPLFIYAIREVYTGNVKIGISSNPAERLKQLQTGNSSKLELVAFIEAADGFKSEKRLHLLNADKHIRGEWFDATTTIGV